MLLILSTFFPFTFCCLSESQYLNRYGAVISSSLHIITALIGTSNMHIPLKIFHELAPG